jgi:hypothetical protein
MVDAPLAEASVGFGTEANFILIFHAESLKKWVGQWLSYPNLIFFVSG